MTGFFSSSTLQQSRPASGLVPKCGACGLYKGCQSPKMPVYGNGRLQIMVVGEAPGQTEDDRSRPFIGKAGQYLRDALDRIGVDLDEDAWTTNALICHPPENATPDTKQIGYCRPNLLNAIRQYKPKLILTLGKSALTSVLEPYWRDIDTMERWVGWQIPLPQFWICPTYHPSFLLRMKNPQLDRVFAEHLEAAFKAQPTGTGRDNFKQEIEILYDENEILGAIAWMDDAEGWLAADYETNCLKPEYPKARIFSCALSNGKNTIAYPWTLAAAKATGALLRSNRTRKIASNLKFEERWTLKEFGHGVRNWGWDTMLATHCLDNRPGICSLKFQALVRLGVPSYNDHIEPFFRSKGHYNRIAEIDIGQLLFYNGMDSLLEYRLAMLQMKEIDL